jgi:hypothetical protein
MRPARVTGDQSRAASELGAGQRRGATVAGQEGKRKRRQKGSASVKTGRLRRQALGRLARERLAPNRACRGEPTPVLGSASHEGVFSLLFSLFRPYGASQTATNCNKNPVTMKPSPVDGSKNSRQRANF